MMKFIFVFLIPIIGFQASPLLINHVYAQDDAFEDAFGDEEIDDFEEFDDEDFQTVKKSDEDDTEESLEEELEQAEKKPSKKKDVAKKEGEELKTQETDPNLEEEFKKADVEEFETDPIVEEPVLVKEDPEELPAPIKEEEPSPMLVQEEEVAPIISQREPDVPNLEYEAQLYQIYLKYYKEPMPHNKWIEIIGRQEKNVYQIQDGDTLWGISHLLFGDGHYWPKIWSKNGNIQNPHLISKGNSIHFLLGNENSGPSFSVSENQSEKKEPVAKAEDPTAYEDDIVLPPSTKVTKPVLKEFPKSLPKFDVEFNDDGYDKSGVASISSIRVKNPGLSQLLSFVTDQPRLSDSEGKIEESESGLEHAAMYQYIYVSFKKGQAQIGDKYLVYIQHGALDAIDEDEQLLSQEDQQGYVYEIVGEAELIDISVPEEVDEDEPRDFFRALVTKNYNLIPVEKGVLDKGSVKKVISNTIGVRSNVVAQVIGGGKKGQQTRFGLDDVVYLNRGRIDGLKEGQLLPIRAIRKLRVKRSKIISSHLVAGLLKIIKADEKYSTAVVVENVTPIEIGDLTGLGPLSPQASPLTQKKSLAENLIDDVKNEEEEEEEFSEVSKNSDTENEESSATDSQEIPKEEDEFSDEDFEE